MRDERNHFVYVRSRFYSLYLHLLIQLCNIIIIIIIMIHVHKNAVVTGACEGTDIIFYRSPWRVNYIGTELYKYYRLQVRALTIVKKLISFDLIT